MTQVKRVLVTDWRNIDLELTEEEYVKKYTGLLESMTVCNPELNADLDKIKSLTEELYKKEFLELFKLQNPDYKEPLIIHEFKTGRFYDNYQVLKYVMTECKPHELSGYDCTVLLVDQSRHLGYTLKIWVSERQSIINGSMVLSEYDSLRNYDDYLSNIDVKNIFGIDRL